MRTIDADELKEQFNWSEVCRLSINEIKQIIDDAPTVRPQGEWIELSDKYFHACSICNKVIFKNSFDNFCSNCGAKMKKGG